MYVIKSLHSFACGYPADVLVFLFIIFGCDRSFVAFFFLAQAFSSSGELGLPFVAGHRLFLAVTSLAVECRL